jgi:SAM-dependent methyltransferase
MNAYRTIATEWSLGIAQCNSCGLLYTNPRLKNSHANYWGEENDAEREQYLLNKYGRVFDGTEPHGRDESYDRHLRDIERVKPSGHLLDIGSHCGFFLRRARGRDWTLTGIEPSPISARLAREKFGLDVRTGMLREVDLPARHFDIVTMTDVFEHVPNPRELLRQVRTVIKDDGLLYIKVPHGNWNRLKQRLLVDLLHSQQFDIWDSREHLAHYTARTLRRMIEMSGYRVARIWIHPPINTGRHNHTLRQLPWRLSTAVYFLTGGWISPLAPSLVAEAYPAD